MLAVAVVARRIAVTGRISVTNARTCRISIAGALAPGTEARSRAVAVDRGAFDADAIIIVEVFSKKSRKTPVRVIDRCQTRLKHYDDAVSEKSDHD